MGQRDRCFSASPLAWKWILEKLVDNKNVGKPILKGLSGYVKDIEEPQCRPLLRRLAIRYLEESLANDRLDISIIPLVQAASEVDTLDSRLQASQRTRDRKLLLRVKAEAAISCIRKETEGEGADWDAFAETLDEVFPSDDLDAEAVIQRKELLAVLAAKDEKVVTKYPLQRLRNDLLHFIKQKKGLIEQPVLDQIAHSYFYGTVQNKSYISAEAQKTSDVGDVHVKHRTRCQAPVSDIVNHAKELFEMQRKEAVTSPTALQPITDRSHLCKLSQNEMCMESKEDCEESLDKNRQHVSQPRQINSLSGSSGGQSSQIHEGNCCIGTLSGQSVGTTEIANGQKRRRESSGMDDVSVGDGKDIPQVDTDSNVRLNARSRANPLKIRRTVNCFECSMGGSLLSCDTCRSSYHLECLGNHLTCKWTCPDCGNLCIVPASKLLPTPPPLGMPNPEELYSTIPKTAVGMGPGASGAASAQHKDLDAAFALGSAVPEKVLTACISATELSEKVDGGPMREAIGLKTLQKETTSPRVSLSPGGHKDGVDHTTGPLFGKRACPLDDDDDVEIIESLSCKRPKTRTFINIADGPEVRVNTATTPVMQAPVEPRAREALQKSTNMDIAGKDSNWVAGASNSAKEGVADAVPSSGSLVQMAGAYIDVNDPVEASDTNKTPNFSKSFKEGAGAQVETAAVEKSTEDEDEEIVEMRKLVDMQCQHFGQNDQEKLCCICGHGGGLVSCDGCPIGMHLKCLGPGESRVDVNDSQFCPYCMRKKALQDVLNAKEAARLAQRQFLEAKKILVGTASLPQITVPKSESPRAEVDGERHDGDLEQTSRPPKPKKKMSSGRKAIPGLRRKALAWTPQEEEALKEGVMRYSHDGGRWGFQWQRILESGFGVFDPSRTGVDLKDKWRNIQRRA